MNTRWNHALFPTLLSLWVGSFLFFSACSMSTSDKPPLPDTTFARVLVDLHLLSARSSQADSLPASTDSLFTYHGIQREEFDATLRYYTRHPKHFSTLYNGVIDTLKALSERNWERASAPSDVSDSLRQRRQKNARE